MVFGDVLGLFGVGALLGFLEPVAFALDLDDLGPMHESIDEGDGASSVGKDVAPFACLRASPLKNRC